MQVRKLGKTDIEIPVVIAGAWAIGGWCWGGTDEADAIAAMQKCIDCGITCIDTAPTYGFGLSEELVGKAVAGRRDEVLIATKCGLRWDTDEGSLFLEADDLEGNKKRIHSVITKDSLFLECERSLKRLKIDTIDLYQIHWPGPNAEFGEAMEALLSLKEQGKIRAIGVSNFSKAMLANCVSHGQLDCNQPKYSALDRKFEEDELPFCIENQIGVIAYSPMEMGLLTGKVTEDRVFPPGDIRGNYQQRPWFKPENRKRILNALDTMKPIADGYGISLANLALAWIIAQKGMTAAIAGVRNPAQVEENARAGDIVLTETEIKTIRDTFEALGAPA